MRLFLCVLLVTMLAGGALCVQAAHDIANVQIIPDCNIATMPLLTKDHTKQMPVESILVEPIDPAISRMELLDTSITRSARVDGWDCVDYSLDFADNNLEWGVLTISRTCNFCPTSHMINYIMHDNETLIIYDGSLDNMYRIVGWQWDTDYYHFWLDGVQPVRNYRRLFDNRGDVL